LSRLLLHWAWRVQIAMITSPRGKSLKDCRVSGGVAETLNIYLCS
jgi:hypothetical protein